MKKGAIIITVVFIVSFIITAFAQQGFKLGDLPKSEYNINIYQVFGFQEGAEGYKIIYLDQKGNPRHLYLPILLRDQYDIFKPEANTFDQNFVIIWEKEGKVERAQWFLPQKINYNLPQYVIRPFEEEDKKIFETIVEKGKLTLEIEAGGVAPVIRAPGVQ